MKKKKTFIFINTRRKKSTGIIIMNQEEGTLAMGEVHPMARSAFSYIMNYLKTDIAKSFLLIESLASTALSGNRTAEICYETLRRIRENEPVSDRYILGLAWFIKEYEESQNV